jgi:hemoglobin
MREILPDCVEKQIKVLSNAGGVNVPGCAEAVRQSAVELGFAGKVKIGIVTGDDILGPMYPAADLPGAEERLRDFLVGRFGGPMRYVEKRGHPRLRMRHNLFRIDQAARDRWVSLMEAALDETELHADAQRMLRQFFHDSATFLINHG